MTHIQQRSIVAFIGPDGSGKTTVIDVLKSAGIWSEHTLSERTLSYGILPSLSSIVGRKRIQQPEGTEGAGMGAPLSPFRCFVLSVWYGMDLLLAWLVVLTRRQPTVFVFSRYYLDFFYQRGYRKACLPLLRLFIFLGPKPDYIFVLRRDPQRIFEQKPELSAAEIRFQYRLIRNRLSKYPAYIEIDASRGIDATVKDVLKRLSHQ